MKNMISKALLGRDARLSVLFVIGVLFMVGLGCSGGKSKDAKPVSSDYYGSWLGADGSTIVIRGDGTGDYHSGGTKIDGGTVEVSDTDKTLSITFFGIGKTLKIDSAPAGGQMKLEGVSYKKSGGEDTKTDKTSSTGSDDTPKGDAPSAGEAGSLVKSSIRDFTTAVESDDFSDFYDNSSKDFRAQYTKEQTASSFKVFVDQKDKLLTSLQDVQSETADFTSAPSVRTEKGFKVLTADGEFPSSPKVVKFETEYVLENGIWKMLKFKIRL